MSPYSDAPHEQGEKEMITGGTGIARAEKGLIRPSCMRRWKTRNLKIINLVRQKGEIIDIISLECLSNIPPSS